MEDKSKSLRQKRSGKLQISNPTLISAPQAATRSAIDLKDIRSGHKSNKDLYAGAVKPVVGFNSSTSLLSSDGLSRNGDSPEPRLRARAANDHTADLVKRRYSTRYTQLPQDDVEIPPMPTFLSATTLPALPSLSSGPRRFAVSDADEFNDGHKITLNPALLDDPNFNPEAFVTSSLDEASESSLAVFQRELQKIKHRADRDTQATVFQNRTQFIRISKEADKLEAEMRNLRNLMTELTATLGQVTVTDATATASGLGSSSNSGPGLGSGPTLGSLTVPARNRGHRSSVANLEALWTSHLQELWRRVEGSQKYLPAIPGRHVVYESGRWVELNSATWKPRRKIHVILLKDHLLIATEKKRIETSTDPRDKQTPLLMVAIKCWPLQDVQLADLAMRLNPGTGDPASSSHSISVRAGPDSLTLATASKELHEKHSLLSNFRKSSEDLRRKLDSDTQDNAQVQDQTAFSAQTSIGQKPAFTDPFSTSKSEALVEVDGQPQSMRWVESQFDELDIDAALQRFEEAVARIEQLCLVISNIRTDQTVQNALKTKLDERAAGLAGTIIRYLTNMHSWMTATERHVGWLSRLGFEDRAREAFLEARSDTLQKRARQVIFDGDLHLYIYQISFIYFTIIQHTVGIFQTCFPTPMLSACVTWAKAHVDGFNSLLQRQLSSVDSNSETYQACMTSAQEHAAMLNHVGMDFKHLLARNGR